MTRAISATPRFCEMYYIWGSQDSGKDTKVKMLHAFLGHGKDKGCSFRETMRCNRLAT